MSDLTCPYCNDHDQSASGEDAYNPCELYEIKCTNCEKVFGYTIEYPPSYTARVLPCANGEPHKWRPIRQRNNICRCEYCQEIRTLDQIDKLEAGE
jgi:uncharacterized Zn-finger protein